MTGRPAKDGSEKDGPGRRKKKKKHHHEMAEHMQRTTGSFEVQGEGDEARKRRNGLVAKALYAMLEVWPVQETAE